MLKKSNFFAICLLFVCCQVSVKTIAHANSDESEVRGGIAVCRLSGGKERVSKTFTVRDNFAELSDVEETLGVEFEGDISSKQGERSLISSVEVDDVTTDDFKINKLLTSNASDAELIIKIDEGDQQVAIVALNQNTNGSLITSPVKLKLTKIRNDKATGIAEVTYPRTVTLSLNSPSLQALEELLDGDGEGQLELKDAVENGSVTLKCSFRNVPVDVTETNDADN